METDSKKLVFLFGAGASVPAGCQTTKQLTDKLPQILRKDPYISSQYYWIEQVWALIERHAKQTAMTMGRFIPNFENLVYAIELLEAYTDIFRLPDEDAIKIVNELGKNLGFNKVSEAYAALSYALMQISSDSQAINPQAQLFQIKGASAKYMWAAKALRKLIADEFPKKHNLGYLDPFKEIISEGGRAIVVATINYDLVIDQFFEDHNICYKDGFSIDKELTPWCGFVKSNQFLTYLKLHGSLTWFQIKKDWFAKEPPNLSVNDIYKCPIADITHLIKDELNKKQLKDRKHKYEFNNPHLIMGGSKDKKILESPFIEISREWLNALASADTVAIVGASASDFHLIQQMKGTLVSNKKLDKVICINPSKDVNDAYGLFFRSITGTENPPYMFFIDCCWDFQKIHEEYKMSLKDMLSMPSAKLLRHFKDVLNT